MKLRSRIGRSVSCRWSNEVATSARSVFSSGDPPVTVTVSVSSPTSSWKLMGVCASTLTTTDGTTAVLKLASSAFTSYVPGTSRSFRKKPDSLVTTVSEVFRSMLVTVTLTPGRIPPLESVTVPLMLPYTACAASGRGTRAQQATRSGSASRRRQ